MRLAVSALNVSKMYELGVVNHGALFRDIQSWIARKKGKEDPHSKIGARLIADGDRKHWALKDISVDIEQGDRIGLIGRNGAGKSTFLKILSRITAPTEGIIKVRGRVASLLEVGTGFHPELTGRENVYLNGSILGMKHKEVKRKFDEIVAFSEIERYIDTPVKRYSSGMYVRLAFAVAAHLDSEILLADEVLAVGDAAFQKKSLGKLEEVSTSEGRTVLFVSHNLTAVGTLCTRGMLLDDGHLQAWGPMSDVLSAYSKESLTDRVVFSEGFIREASIRQIGQTINVSVEWEQDGKINTPCLGIKFYDLQGRILFVVNPYDHEMIKVAGLGGMKNVITVDIHQPLLNDGTYYVTLVFADENRSYETREKCLQVDVYNMVQTKYPVNTQQHGYIFPVCEYRYS